MIWSVLLGGIVSLVNGISNLVPEFVLVTQLPWGLDDALTGAFGAIYAWGSLFPFLLPAIHVILLYIAYRLGKIVLEIFLIRKALGR
jgi:hypothetical protein